MDALVETARRVNSLSQTSVLPPLHRALYRTLYRKTGKISTKGADKVRDEVPKTPGLGQALNRAR